MNRSREKVNISNFGLVLIRVPSWFDLVTPKRCLNIPEVLRGPYTQQGRNFSHIDPEYRAAGDKVSLPASYKDGGCSAKAFTFHLCAKSVAFQCLFLILRLKS